MKMLLYKAWVETRVRFFASLVAATIVCVFNMQQHAWLVKWWAEELADPNGYHLTWMVLGVNDYGWYLWHYLYDNYLQQIWALFALLFAFGGLIREKSSGTALFSLGLPISRRAVSRIGGTLSALDLPGKGCVFSIVLPKLARAPAPSRRRHGALKSTNIRD